MENAQRPGINYLYFGTYFALLVFMSACSIFAKDNLSGSRFFFFLYAAAQAAIESSLLTLAAWAIRRYFNRWIFSFYIGATFLLLVFHIFDFLMDRILDLSIWETISFVLDETFTNFMYLLDASGVPLWMWGLFFITLATLPLLGIFLYRVTDSISMKRPLPLKPEHLLLSFFCLPLGLLFWDFSASRAIHPDAYTSFLQSLPWKLTFLEPKSVVIPLAGPPRKSSAEDAIAAEIANDQTVLKSKPNIYLFITESLRADIIDAETAPHLNALRASSSPFDVTLSNANGTNLSWFSIFYSQFSHQWKRLQKIDGEMGSPPLQLLKKWGYKIRLYSSAQLGYYGTEKLLFGKDVRLLDSDQRFLHAPPVSAAKTDADALAKLQKDLAEDPSLAQGQVFIVFWDSTHFDYSWPQNRPPKFIPFASKLIYCNAFYSQKKIELIKNRYRNAVNYIDSLFGQFLETLPNKEESIVIFTGDHGEEFFEHGHLFHGSHLVKEQTRIPLIMKFGEKVPEKQQTLVTQIDIFPSLFDYLSGSIPSFLQGQSIFRERQWPFAVIARFNAGRNPYEFCIHSAKHKLIARFSNHRDIFQSTSLQIRSLRSPEDKTLAYSQRELSEWIHSEFGPAFDRLFTGTSYLVID